MVTLVNYKKRTNAEGEDFFALELQGGLSMVQSKETGQFYATAKKTSVTSTFDEEACKELIGTKIEGEIVKVQCEPYTFAIEQTGEEITLDFRWQFRPPAVPDHEFEKAVFGERTQVA